MQVASLAFHLKHIANTRFQADASQKHVPKSWLGRDRAMVMSRVMVLRQYLPLGTPTLMIGASSQQMIMDRAFHILFQFKGKLPADNKELDKAFKKLQTDYPLIAVNNQRGWFADKLEISLADNMFISELNAGIERFLETPGLYQDLRTRDIKKQILIPKKMIETLGRQVTVCGKKFLERYPFKEPVVLDCSNFLNETSADFQKQFLQTLTRLPQGSLVSIGSHDLQAGLQVHSKLKGQGFQAITIPKEYAMRSHEKLVYQSLGPQFPPVEEAQNNYLFLKP